MLNFTEWLTFNEGLKIINVDPEEDWEMGQEAENIAHKVNIHISRNKNLTLVALNDQEEVIGAVYTSYEKDHSASENAGEEMFHFDFDVVVDPRWQGYEMVGIKLIKAAEQERKHLDIMYGHKSYTRTWVVNPRLAKILQHPRFGYESEGEHEGGSHHLTKY